MVVAVGDEGRQRMHVVRVLNNRNFIRLKDREKKTRDSCQGGGEYGQTSELPQVPFTALFAVKQITHTFWFPGAYICFFF